MIANRILKFALLATIPGLVLTGIATDQTYGQGTMIQTSTPFNSINNSFYERMGVDFGFSLQGGQGPGSRIVGALPGNIATPNLNFSQNGIGSAVPQFGGYDPNANAQFGFSVLDGGNRFSLGFDFGQGASTTHTNTTPTVVSHNGATGSVFDGTLQPFVTGLIPIIGRNRPVMQGFNVVPPRSLPTHIDLGPRSLEGYSDRELHGPRPTESSGSSNVVSTATVGAASVNSIKERRAQEKLAEANQLKAEVFEHIEKGDQYLEDGKTVLARLNYRKALQKMKGMEGIDDIRRETGEKFEKLSQKK